MRRRGEDERGGSREEDKGGKRREEHKEEEDQRTQDASAMLLYTLPSHVPSSQVHTSTWTRALERQAPHGPDIDEELCAL